MLVFADGSQCGTLGGGCVEAEVRQRALQAMGVGRPEDILLAVERGIDMFDCVLPTRNGRNATAFVKGGTLKLRNSRFKRDPAPIESDCDCPTCRHWSRAYLHHLFLAEEMLGPTLVSLHNIAHYNRLMAQIWAAIEERRFAEYRRERLEAQG